LTFYKVQISIIDSSKTDLPIKPLGEI